MEKQTQNPQLLQNAVSGSALLTEQSKKDFEMFIFRQKGTLPKGIDSYNYYDLQNSYIISDIISWFDKEKIIIENMFFEPDKYFITRIYFLENHKHIGNSDDRISGTIKAIVEANEIYNSRFRFGSQADR